MGAAFSGPLVMGIAAAALLVLAWMIGVLGMVRLVNNYRAHPERYPDAQGLARWMGWTLGAGGFSLGLCALSWGAGGLGEDVVGIWAGATAAILVAFSLGGLARYRRMPAPGSPGAKGR